MSIDHCWWLASGLLAGSLAVPREPVVQALRFRQCSDAPACELSHGGGAWRDCLNLPDDGVMCTVVTSARATFDAAGRWRVESR